MTLPQIFATVPTDTRVAGARLDLDLDKVASMMIIPCAASGDNEIALLPFVDLPTLPNYLDYQRFSFVAPTTSTGPVVVNFAGLGALPFYRADGVTQLGNGEVVYGEYYDIVFVQALDGGEGGFVGAAASVAGAGPTGPTGPSPGTTGTTGPTATSAQAPTGPTGPPGSAAFRVIRTQRFTNSGTYTPDPNLVYCTIELVGGGGGGGGNTGQALDNVAAAGGGGAGAYNRKSVSKATIGASQVVTIGAGGVGGTNVPTNGGTGGTTSVGSIVTAPGGLGGITSTGGGPTDARLGGLGGTNVDGDFNGSTGQPGLTGFGFNPNGTLLLCVGGNGGSGPWGGGGAGALVFNIAGANGGSPQDFGAGGGGSADNSTGVSRVGGAGTAGLVVITEYCSQ